MAVLDDGDAGEPGHPLGPDTRGSAHGAEHDDLHTVSDQAPREADRCRAVRVGVLDTHAEALSGEGFDEERPLHPRRGGPPTWPGEDDSDWPSRQAARRLRRQQGAAVRDVVDLAGCRGGGTPAGSAGRAAVVARAARAQAQGRDHTEDCDRG